MSRHVGPIHSCLAKSLEVLSSGPSSWGCWSAGNNSQHCFEHLLKHVEYVEYVYTTFFEVQESLLQLLPSVLTSQVLMDIAGLKAVQYCVHSSYVHCDLFSLEAYFRRSCKALPLYAVLATSSWKAPWCDVSSVADTELPRRLGLSWLSHRQSVPLTIPKRLRTCGHDTGSPKICPFSLILHEHNMNITLI